MIAQQAGTERANSKTIERWTGYLEGLHVRIAHRFQRPEVRARAYRYLTGLLGEVGRKNSWQMAEAIGEPRPRGVQTPPQRRPLGRTPRVRRPARVRCRAPRRRGERGPRRGRDRFFEEGREVGGGGPPIYGYRWQEGELPGGGASVLRLQERGGLHRSGSVPAARVGGGPRSA